MSNKHNDIEPALERYLALCKRTYEEMERNGTWPWPDEPDSTLSDYMIDSDDNSKNL